MAAKQGSGAGKKSSKTVALDAIPDDVNVGELVGKAMAKKPAVMGRPSAYTPELGDEICELVSEGWSSRRIAKLDYMPDLRTIFRWLRSNEEFRHQYARAKSEELPDAMQEMIHQVAEGTLSGKYDPQSARVAIEAYKWTAAKLMPKKYGDKIDVTTAGEKLPTPIFGGLSIPSGEIIDVEKTD